MQDRYLQNTIDQFLEISITTDLTSQSIITLHVQEEHIDQILTGEVTHTGTYLII
jgi:predicted metal-dependent TIM-barrel fold hydrolase